MNFQMLISFGGICSAIGAIIACVKTIRSISNNGIDKRINKTISPMLTDIKSSIDNITEQISESKKESDEREMQKLRYECLCFASDLRKGIPKTRQEYEEIFRMEDSYNKLIDKYKVLNGYMHEEMLYVHKQYQALLNI